MSCVNGNQNKKGRISKYLRVFSLFGLIKELEFEHGGNDGIGLEMSQEARAKNVTEEVELGHFTPGLECEGLAVNNDLLIWLFAILNYKLLVRTTMKKGAQKQKEMAPQTLEGGP